VDTKPHIKVTDIDLERLQKYMNASGVLPTLEEELARAEIVAAENVPPTLVTMNSRVVFEDLQTHRRREVTVVYPQDADIDHGRISVMSPVGAALLGLSVGQEIDWSLPSGRTARFRIAEIPYQPEASGDFHL
jgi:regulator of nucleoside diphosphate kinase